MNGRTPRWWTAALIAGLFTVLPLALGANGGAGTGGSPSKPFTGGSGLLGFSAASADGQQLVVIDPGRQALAVYHVHGQSGQVTLQSVRRLTYDLMMEGYNATPPLPQELRQLADRMAAGGP
jgi:hypothetical protein